MTLGPCAEAFGLSASSVFLATVIQLPVMFVATLHYPSAKVDFYATAARLVLNPATNVTAVDLHDPITLHYMHSVHINVLFLLCSGLVCIFGVSTLYIVDKVTVYSQIRPAHHSENS